MKVPTDIEMQLLSFDGGETQTLNYVPIVASLPIPNSEYYGYKELQLIVTIILNNEKKELFRQFVTKWK